MKKIYRYYGMCGTFKATTIKSLLKGPRLGYTLPVWSMIKPWKSLCKGVMKDLIQDTNFNLAALSLCNLENVLEIAEHDPDIEFLLCERGVLDNLYYQKMKDDDLTAMKIKSIRQEELEIEARYGFKEVRNTLLIMEDKEFIDSVILSEPTRRAWFPDVDTYLQEQEKYIKFLFSNLEGNLVQRQIESAREYIESLGLEFNTKN